MNANEPAPTTPPVPAALTELLAAQSEYIRSKVVPYYSPLTKRWTLALAFKPELQLTARKEEIVYATVEFDDEHWNEGKEGVDSSVTIWQVGPHEIVATEAFRQKYQTYL